MNITLPPEAQAIIEREIESGRFATQEDVIVTALYQLSETIDAPHVPDEWLVEARAQADRGDTTPWSEDYLEESSQRARENARRGHKVRDEVRY
jgi:Arc/MetJ-type ribon-helix-helix transcriptional regulator